jgi:ribosomal protein S18 acetylase RimI-like enzyme
MNAPAPADCFSRSYAEARSRFLSACAEAGAGLRSHRHALPGPDGAPLYLDEARFGAPGARRVLFVASGTHGIEGFCGSGIQTFLLRSGVAARLAADTALVLVHAVNPYGFAWLRRVNEDNVDLNRNFLDHGGRHPENPDYDGLYAALNPARLDEETLAASLAAIRAFESERGSAASYRALSGGQYRHPRGVQYGGREPAWSNRVLRGIWERHASEAELAVFLDLHSGLGPTGVGLLLQTAPAGSVAAELAASLWEGVIRAEPAPGSDAALASGLIGPAFVAARAPAASTGLVLEFGTRDMVQVVLAVQADNWLQHHGRRDSAEGRAIGERMRAAFFLEEEDWKEKVCRRAEEVVERALARMPDFETTSAAESAAPRVRPARPADAEVLAGFNVAMARETEGLALDPVTVRAAVAAFLTDPARGRWLVVESGGEIEAALMLTFEWSDWRGGFFWWIQNVYVRPAARRRGHYRRLHDHVRSLAAADPEVCGLRLYVEQENRDAQATYRALGMAETHYRVYEQSLPRF